MDGAAAPGQTNFQATTYPYLSTKVFIPALQSGIVLRPRLTERLQQGLDRKLTLISAPPGFGKTTLVAEWRATGTPEAQRLAWVTLDEGDNDPGRFLNYLVRAIQTVAPGIGSRTLSLVETGLSRDPTLALADLINDLGLLSERLVVALDDYHVISSESVHEAFTFLLDHMPENVHVIITSRQDPPLPLPRLRASRELIEFRADALRFTVEEAAAFLNEVMQLDLTAEQVTSIEARTEGWIAGLLLAALSAGDSADRDALLDALGGDHRYIFDYLAEEVLRRQPPEIQHFLTRTAVLERMNGELADAITGCGSGQGILESLTRSNIFTVPLDYSRTWFRYHHLFGEFLSTRFRQLDPAGWVDAHRKASEWFYRAGQLHDAVEHAIAAGDHPRLILLVEKAGRRLVAGGQIQTLMRWLDEAGEAACREHPRLALLRAWASMFDRRFEDAERWLRTIDPASIDASRDIAFRADFAMCQVTYARFCGSIDTVIEASEWAIQELRKAGLPDDAPNWGILQLHLGSGFRQAGDTLRSIVILTESIQRSRTHDNRVAHLNAMSELAAAYWNLGQFRQAETTASQALAFEEEAGLRPIAMTSPALLALADIHRERNDLDEAGRLASIALRMVQDDLDAVSAAVVSSGHPARREEREGGTEVVRLEMALYDVMARIELARGDLPAAMETAHDAIARGRQLSLSPVEMMVLDALQAALCLASSEVETATDWASRHELDIDDPISFLTEPVYLTYARLLVEQGRYPEAGRLLERLRRTLERSGRQLRLIQARLLQSILLDATGEREAALALLAGAIQPAESDGYLRVFLDTHPDLVNLLGAVRARGGLAHVGHYIDSMLEAAGIDLSPEVPVAADRQNLLDPLTKREIEVLRLLATGLSNREIADQIFVTVGTIKRHTYNIYGKLGASNRTQAVNRGRELGLLE